VKKNTQSKRQIVYEQGKDAISVLHNIVSDMRDERNKEMLNRWDISHTELKGCDIKVSSAGVGAYSISIIATEYKGDLRKFPMDASMQKKLSRDTVNLLSKFEKEIRKQFKERTGKALTLKDAKIFVNWQKIALNGLYKYVAVKSGVYNDKIEPNEYGKIIEVD
jgi:hypothetical protein